MTYSIKKILNNTLATVELGYRAVRGVDYQSLSQYILKINKHKNIDAVLNEVSHCFRDILYYDIIGFALKNANFLDLWVNPWADNTLLIEYIKQNFDSQNVDYCLHNIVKEKITDCQNTDRLDINSIKPYDITNSYYMARLYVVPKRKMPYYHDAIMSIIINSLNITLDKNFNIQQLENAAAIDPLTNCYNRRALEKLMANDIAYCKRQRNELSVIMLDMDNFKEINDMYGHQAGDAVLKDVSTLIPSAVRKSDYLARYGGEEFVLVLPNSTLYNTVQLAHKLKHMIERHTVNVGGNSISVTASFGVASLETKKDADSLLREADERLYKAKSLGKNIVVPSLLPCFADSKFVIRDDARKYSRVCVT